MTDHKAVPQKQMDWLDRRAYKPGEFEANQAIYDTLWQAFTAAARSVMTVKLGGVTHDDFVAFQAQLTDLKGLPYPKGVQEEITKEVEATLADPKGFEKFAEMHADELESDAVTCGQLIINMLLGSEGMHNCMENPATMQVTPELLRPAISPACKNQWNEIAAYAADRYALAPQDVDELICTAWKNLGGGTRDVPINTKLAAPAATIAAALSHKFTAA